MIQEELSDVHMMLAVHAYVGLGRSAQMYLATFFSAQGMLPWPIFRLL